MTHPTLPLEVENEEGTFCVTMNMVKTETVAGAPLYFGLKADNQNERSSAWHLVWSEEVASDLAVPIGEWISVEVDIVEGNENTSRAQVRVTTADGVRQEVANVTGWTHRPDGSADGLSDINTIKLYTSGEIMRSAQCAGAPTRNLVR